MQKPFFIKKIAVMGAGVMGAQIAAHCVNAGIKTYLFDLPGTDTDKSAVVNKAIANLNKLKPSPLGAPKMSALLKACNYDEHLTELQSCDLVIEVIAERLDWKEALYLRIQPYLNPEAILVSNTSGLSINVLAKVLPEALKHRFCGVHFFNPPRYMHLAELIPAQTTDPRLVDALESWLTSRLGKGVVRAKDTPNFVANRVGVFSLLTILHWADEMKLGLDEVDALTGALLGRPKSATFRTMDVVGLDTMQHVIHTMEQQLQDDPWHPFFTLPTWMTGLIQQGHLGQKSGLGIYRKQGKVIEVYDVARGEYRMAAGVVSDEVKAIMSLTDPKERMQRLMSSDHPQAQFLAACFTDLFHYCAFHLQAIAHTVRDVDLALRWGFGWQHGPFETWQSVGVAEMISSIEQAILKKKSMSQVGLPHWLQTLHAFYKEEGAFAPETLSYEGRSKLPVYQRQFFPDKVLNEPRFQKKMLYEDEGVQLWHLQDDIAVAQFKSKANTIGGVVLDGLTQALDHAEGRCQGIIIYQADTLNFSSGANLREVAAFIQANQFDKVERMIVEFQQLMMRIKYSAIPVVAALRGKALGGGCELMMHCHQVVAAFESYPGLVEAGVGLIPAGGGCKEMVMRAATKATQNDVMTPIRGYFEQIAMCVVAGSAIEGRQRDYLQAADTIVMHPNEVLNAALMQVKAMVAGNHYPPIPQRFMVGGVEGRALLEVGLVNWLEGGFISQHDYMLASQLAHVLCGGNVNQGELVDEAWILQLEKEAFMTLAQTKPTADRINHLLETGKPLRN